MERRFYPRVVPQAPIFIAFAEGQDSLLLNLSENGLLVSTPAELACNFVARISIPLNGLPKPVQVNVRVVWVSEARKLAGIQLLDLSEHDRQLIRKWGARESAQSSQPHLPLVIAKPSSTAPETPHLISPFMERAPSNKPVGIAPAALTPTVRPRSTLNAAGIATYSALVVTVCLAAAFFARNGAQAHYFARSLESAYKTSVAGPPAQSIPASLPNPEELKPDTISQPASSSQGVEAAQTPEPTNANGNPDPAAIHISPSQRQASRESPRATSKPISQINPAPDTPAATSETLSGPRDDQSQPAAIPPASDSGPISNAPANSPASADTTPGTPPTSPATPLAAEPIRNATRANDVATGTPATIPSSPIASPAHKSEATVIQMDAPARQVLEIHLPSGYYAPYFNLPGERVLESSTATMHIQRSVRWNAKHARWSSSRNKKVVIGGLISRVDPQSALVQLIPGDSVRVRATVAQDGRVEIVNPIYGPPYLAHIVADAVHQWRFQPTLLDGKPVETQCYVVVQFHAPTTRTARK